MLKRFCNDKYKNDLTTNVGDFLESLLGDAELSMLNPAGVPAVNHSGSSVKDTVVLGLNPQGQVNLHKV